MQAGSRNKCIAWGLPISLGHDIDLNFILPALLDSCFLHTVMELRITVAIIYSSGH